MLPFFLLLFASATARAQIATGAVEGKITVELPKGDALYVELVEGRHGQVVQEGRVGDDGRFVLRDVPYARYILHVRLGDAILAEREIEITGGVPVGVAITSLKNFQSASVLVTADLLRPDPTQTGARTFWTASEISRIPASTSEQKVESILLNTPGAVPDEDGRLHFRGEDAQLQYVIDGIPVTANLTRIYGSLFNARLARSVELRTGGLDAEYGRATSAIVAVTTRSGFDRPWFAEASGSYGSFNARDVSIGVGGNIDGRVGIYAAGALGESDRYLDPIAEGDAIHSAGSWRHLFIKGDIALGHGLDIDLLGSLNRTEFEVPNGGIRTPAQDQRGLLDDHIFGGRLRFGLGADVVLSLVGYSRLGEATITSGGLLRIVTAEDSLKALAENEKFFIGSERSNRASGLSLQGAFAFDAFDLKHQAKAGIGGEATPANEFFTFAVTNSALSDPDTAGGDVRYQRHDLTRGSSPMVVDESVDGDGFFAWIDDRFQIGGWTISAGLRYDVFDMTVRETALSPRLNVARSIHSDLALRASYNRIVMQPPAENLLVSSSAEAVLLAGREQEGTPTDVASEKSHVFEVGTAWRLSEFLAMDVSIYGKLIENFLVKAELGNSGVIFPINLKEGRVFGGEVRIDVRNWNRISGFLWLAVADARGRIPEDGSSPIAAGLILGEEGLNYSHPFRGEDAFPTEHNQLATAAWQATYNATEGWYFLLGGRLDSGLPFDLVGRNGEGLNEEESRVELRNRGYSDAVIDLLELGVERPGSPDKSVAPHVTLDLGAGIDLKQVAGISARIGVTVMNVLDTPYLYKFESSFGGTHFGRPRAFSIETTVTL